MPDELWTEVHDIVQKTGIKTIPMEKKCKKAKWLSGEALQIAVKRREGKGKGEKESYTHWNAEFQRIARRDKKDFLSDQCKVIEGNNRVGKTRDLFKKIRDTKGSFHAKMGTMKDRNSMDLTDAKDIEKRCPGIGFFSRVGREIGVFRHVTPPTTLCLEFTRDWPHPEVRRECGEPLPNKAGELTLLSRTGGEKVLR